MDTVYLSYVDYLNYTSQVNQDVLLNDTAFALAEFQARKRIDYLTDCRVAAMAAVPEAVKLCMVRLIEVNSKFGIRAQLDNPVIASFNTDGYSESYGSAESQMAAVDKRMDATIREMLYGELDDKGTPLLYRGVCG